jgi:hypothetical protein
MNKYFWMKFIFLWSTNILEIKVKLQRNHVVNRSSKHCIVRSSKIKNAVKQVLETMEVGLNLPITLKIDNVGEI